MEKTIIGIPCKHLEIQKGCRFCQEYENNPRYKTLIDSQGGIKPTLRPKESIKQCIYLGEDTGERVDCLVCNGKIQLKVFKCQIYGKCTVEKPIDGYGCCRGCLQKVLVKENIPDPTPSVPVKKLSIKQWSYGITTVPSRLNTTLPITVASLDRAGFNKPIIFQDGDKKDESYKLNLERVIRPTVLSGHGNWVLTAYELYIRSPNADYYAIFQDDFVTYKNLRNYLERCEYPKKGYLNLYTFPENESLANGRKGWYESNQLGKGAVALVFNREALATLLTHRHMFDRPQESLRGWRAIDGGIVTAMSKAGWKEYVHNPSLVQHIGNVSTLGNKPHAKSVSFQGEEFDANNLL